MSIVQNLPQVLTLIGGIGVAAFGIVEASKSAFPGFDRIGFNRIRQIVQELTPEGALTPLNTLPQSSILKSLEGNWASGTPLASQQEIAKSLIYLHLSVDNSKVLAFKTNVDAEILTQIAASVASGADLTPQQIQVQKRFDASVATLLDGAYQVADRAYRNTMRMTGFVVALTLGIFAGWGLHPGYPSPYWGSSDMWYALAIGFVAGPIAPLARDVSTAVSSAVKKKVQSYL